MGANYTTVVVPKCKLYDKKFQKLANTSYATYDKKRKRWACIIPNPYLPQRYKYK